MNIFIREIKAHRKSLIIWGVSVIMMVAASMSKYSAISATGQSMNEIIAQMPASIKSIIGVGSFDLAKASGYYGVLFLYLVVMATIHAAMLGADMISKEERDKTSEFLFVKPVSRNTIISAKLLAAFSNIVLFNIVTLLSSLLLVGHYSRGEAVAGIIVKLMTGMFALQVMFMLIGTGIAAVSKRPKTATTAATAILLVAFVLYKAIELDKNLDILKYITPFKYFDAKDLISGPGFEPVFVILSVVIMVIMFGITYVFYNKRDLHI